MPLFNVIGTRRARIVIFNRKHQNSNTTTYNLEKKTKSALDIKLPSNQKKRHLFENEVNTKVGEIGRAHV